MYVKLTTLENVDFILQNKNKHPLHRWSSTVDVDDDDVMTWSMNAVGKRINVKLPLRVNKTKKLSKNLIDSKEKSVLNGVKKSIQVI